MPAIIGIVLGFLTRDLIYAVFKYLFTGFLGLVSYAFTQRLISKYINAALSELLKTDSIGMIMNLSRLDDAISILVGAMVICAAIKAMGIKLTGVGA